MKRTIAVVFVLATTFASGTVAVAGATTAYHESLCQVKNFACRDPYFQTAPNDEYIGHDEPTVEFRSSRPGTGGGDLTYTMVLPRNPPVRPNQAGTGGHLGLPAAGHVLARTDHVRHRVVPELHEEVPPDSDANGRFTSTNPSSKRFLGKAPGSAFMELQFYEPGWVPQFAGFGCSDTQWCANLTIDSLSDNAATGQPQNDDCLNNHFLVGEEPVNWAYITQGRPLAGAGEPARTVGRSEPDRPQPGPEQGAADELRRHHPGAHA